MSHITKKQRCHAEKKDQTQPDSPPIGNTVVGGEEKKKKLIRGRGWFFTQNNPDSLFSLVKSLESQRCDYVIQYEIGHEGTPHLQGAVYFDSQRTEIQVDEIDGKTHWEKARNKKACLDYCQKIDTAAGRIWHRGFALHPKDPLLLLDLRPWQKDVMKIIEEEPDNRTIHWFWDREGAAGKTILAKSLAITKGAIILSGKATDIQYAISQQVNKHYKEVKIIIFNYSRSNEEHLSYQALEQVKDGLFFSSKYESEMCIYDCPHVFCFANFAPQQSKLSQDRWDIKEINDVTYAFI